MRAYNVALPPRPIGDSGTNAIKIKELNPEAQVMILYRDLRTYGLLEDYYQLARQKGVMFLRFDAQDPPKVEPVDGAVRVTFRDRIIGRLLQVDADLVTLSAGMVATDTEELSSMVKLARTPEGDQVYLVDSQGERHISTHGTVGLPFFGQLILDCLNRTEIAMTQRHTFLAAELALTAQAQALRIPCQRTAHELMRLA